MYSLPRKVLIHLKYVFIYNNFQMLIQQLGNDAKDFFFFNVDTIVTPIVEVKKLSLRKFK